MQGLTVGELIKALQGLPLDASLELPGGLTFQKIGGDSEGGYYMEVDEPLAHLQPSFMKRNPHVKAAFIHVGEMLPGQMVSGPFDVSVD